MDKYRFFSPTDFRYAVKDLEDYLSEDAFTKYKAKGELALIKTLSKHGICPQNAVREVERAITQLTTREVYEEEGRIKHDIRALVNKIGEKVSEGVKPYIHLTATSYDIIDTARALMYKDAVNKVILQDMVKLERTWIKLARNEKDTIQIGRTHGQHAIPITFGFAISQYVDRLGNCILKVKESADNLVGKFSGAVGAYNASALFFKDPEQFEEDLLRELGLKPARISTQIVPPEPFANLIHSIILSLGVLANFADDIRHLQRTEIDEVREFFGEEQVGSSTMPQKRNPITFENVKSVWKEFTPRMVTAYMDLISEHQRDLTNSLSQRYIPELLVMFDYSVRRMYGVSRKLVVNKEKMRRNLGMEIDKTVAEPLQILLSVYGCQNAHEKIKQLTQKSYETGKPLTEIILQDLELKPYLEKFNEKQLKIISNPEEYVGIASKKTDKICGYWGAVISNLEKTLGR